MKLRIFSLICFVLLVASVLSGCCSPNGVFARTEERAVNFGNSVTNIALDGNGIN